MRRCISRHLFHCLFRRSGLHKQGAAAVGVCKLVGILALGKLEHVDSLALQIRSERIHGIGKRKHSGGIIRGKRLGCVKGLLGLLFLPEPGLSLEKHHPVCERERLGLYQLLRKGGKSLVVALLVGFLHHLVKQRGKERHLLAKLCHIVDYPLIAAKVKSKVDKTYNLLVGKLAVLRHQVFECRLAVVRVAGLEPHYVEDKRTCLGTVSNKCRRTAVFQVLVGIFKIEIQESTALRKCLTVGIKPRTYEQRLIARIVIGNITGIIKYLYKLVLVEKAF